MFREIRVVDNRVFLLGLDEMYREAMKRYESDELLVCARQVAAALKTPPASVPVEGYYTETPELTEYFLFMRALQAQPVTRLPEVAKLQGFQRLHEVTSSQLYGLPQPGEMLLPAALDALAVALDRRYPEWTVNVLVEGAFQAATETDDCSLVGLAARTRDPVILTALRESVVLYSAVMCASLPGKLSREPQYEWEVDEDLARCARQFVRAFNSLFDERLPAPDERNAEQYWQAHSEANILGRCVRIGATPPGEPERYYHWAILRGPGDSYVVQEFWHEELWTTERYRREMYAGNVAALSKVRS